MTLPTIEQLEAMLANATPGPWTGHNMVHADHGGPMTPEEIGEYVSNSVKIGDPDRFMFISGKHDDGGYADVCHTGNGPRGMYNTALIALAPTLAAQRIADAKRIAELEALVTALDPAAFDKFAAACDASEATQGSDDPIHDLMIAAMEAHP